MHVFLNGAFDLALFCHRNHTYFITGTFHITWQINEKLSIKEILCLFTFKKMYLHYNFIVILIKKKSIMMLRTMKVGISVSCLLPHS